MKKRILFGLIIGLVGVCVSALITHFDRDIITLNNVQCVEYEQIPESNYTNVTFKDNDTGEEYKVVIFSVYTYNYSYLKRGETYSITYEEKRFGKPDNLIQNIKKKSEL